MARAALKHMKITNDDEQKIILSAIYHHANKDLVHDEYDEILKDADVLQPFLNDAGSRIFHLALPRLNHLRNELGISANPAVYGSTQQNNTSRAGIRQQLADIAEMLASRKICGKKSNQDFMDLIHYYPEASAFNELIHGWCAAFVYHCCIKAGMELPIKSPPASCRFAGVGAWYEWGKAMGYCHFVKDGFIPDRGDIVIYDNIIPAENKPEDSLWHDHIGVVLDCRPDQLKVAEGNINNKNIAGILMREQDKTIGCYLRIPDDYQYDGWKYDYKTGQVRIEKY